MRNTPRGEPKPPFVSDAFLDFSLAWLIEQTQLTQPSPFRRLKGIENTIAELARQWRNRRRIIDPAAQIRMSEATRVTMCAWLEAPEWPQARRVCGLRRTDRTRCAMRVWPRGR